MHLKARHTRYHHMQSLLKNVQQYSFYLKILFFLGFFDFSLSRHNFQSARFRKMPYAAYDMHQSTQSDPKLCFILVPNSIKLQFYFIDKILKTVNHPSLDPQLESSFFYVVIGSGLSLFFPHFYGLQKSVWKRDINLLSRSEGDFSHTRAVQVGFFSVMTSH